MTATSNKDITQPSRSNAGPRHRGADRFVMGAQGLVILAIAVGLRIEGGWRPGASVGVAISMAAALLILKKMRRSSRSDDELATSALPEPEPVSSYVPVSVSSVTRDSTTQMAPPPIPAFAFDELAALAAAVSASAPAIAPSPPSLLPPPLPRYGEPPSRLPPPLHQLKKALPVSEPRLTEYGADAAQDYWSHRPSQPRFEARATPQTNTVQAHSGQSTAPSATLRETDVEAIQSLIKKLADEVNLAELERHDGQDQFGQASAISPDDPGAVVNAPEMPPQLFHPEEGVSHSLDALRVTAETMRAPSHLVFGHELPPPIPQTSTRGSILAAAIAAGQTDVLLEPIMGLATQDAQHFEVSIRLRGPDGAALDWDPRDFAYPNGELRGTGLLPLFDAAKIARTAAVARRLGDRGKTGAVFSSYSGEALTDASFRNDAATASRDRTATSGQLVLTFSQSDARAFQAPEWSAIADMRAQGFRFALSGVTDLDMDLEGLVNAGFEFVKLDAEVFLTGLNSPAGLIPSADVCGFVSGLGLALVVEHIDDEERFARVAEFGALLGQGRLFGGARLLKAESSGSSGQAAA